MTSNSNINDDTQYDVDPKLIKSRKSIEDVHSDYINTSAMAEFDRQVSYETKKTRNRLAIQLIGITFAYAAIFGIKEFSKSVTFFDDFMNFFYDNSSVFNTILGACATAMISLRVAVLGQGFENPTPLQVARATQMSRIVISLQVIAPLSGIGIILAIRDKKSWINFLITTATILIIVIALMLLVEEVHEQIFDRYSNQRHKVRSSIQSTDNAIARISGANKTTGNTALRRQLYRLKLLQERIERSYLRIFNFHTLKEPILASLPYVIGDLIVILALTFVIQYHYLFIPGTILSLAVFSLTLYFLIVNEVLRKFSGFALRTILITADCMIVIPGMFGIYTHARDHDYPMLIFVGWIIIFPIIAALTVYKTAYRVKKLRIMHLSKLKKIQQEELHQLEQIQNGINPTYDPALISTGQLPVLPDFLDGDIFKPVKNIFKK